MSRAHHPETPGRLEADAEIIDLLTGVAYGVTELQRSMTRLEERLDRIAQTATSPDGEVLGRRHAVHTRTRPVHSHLPIEKEIWRSGG